MSLDLNADLGTMLKGLMGKGGATPSAEGAQSNKNVPKYLQEPYKNIVLSSVGMVLFIVIFVFIIFLPKLDANEVQRAEVARLQGLKTEADNIVAQIAELNNALTTSKEHYAELLEEFSNSEDLGELYQSISQLAMEYNLVVLNIKELERPKEAPKPATPGSKKQAAADAKTAKDAKAPPANKGMQVGGVKADVELKGWYANYIRFRQELAQNEELLTVNAESVTVGDPKEDQGRITVKLTLSTYAIDKNPFYKAIGEDPNAQEGSEGNG